MKGTDNIVADTVSRLKYNMDINTCDINVYVHMILLVWLFNSYVDTALASDPFHTLDAYVVCSTHYDTDG